MKPHLEKLIARKRAGNAGTLIGCYATETPDESTIYLQMIEGLLCSSEVWRRPRPQWSWTEEHAIELLADAITAGAEIALCGELKKLMVFHHFLSEDA